MLNWNKIDAAKQNPFLAQMIAGVDDEQSNNNSMVSMLSPRNIFKYISNTIEEYNTKPKVYKPDPGEESQFLQTFDQYWLKIQKEHGKHQSYKIVKKTSVAQKQQINQALHMKLKLQKIPKSYFEQKYQFFYGQKFNKVALKRKQQETTEYLDEIQILIWSKTSKSPQKFFNCIGNFNQTINEVQATHQKVKRYRESHHEKMKNLSQSQLNIKKIHEKKERIIKTLAYLQSVKKIKSVKEQSKKQSAFISLPQNCNREKDQLQSKLQILENVKKKELESCQTIKSLQKIICNLQAYRQQIKIFIYKEFGTQIVDLMSKILYYDKNMWYQSNVRPTIMGKQCQNGNKIGHNVLQDSKLNITILDQSCFGNTNDFHFHRSLGGYDSEGACNGFTKKLFGSSEGANFLRQKLTKIWSSIVKFDLYDEEQINELIMRELIKQNTLFNKDLSQYLTKVLTQQQENSPANLKVDAILQEEIENQEEGQKSKQVSSTQEASQQLQQQHAKSPSQSKSSAMSTQTPKKNKYLSTISTLTGIKEINNLNDLSKLKKKTINTFKRFGNVKKLGEAMLGTNSQKKPPTTEVKGTQKYCKVKESQIKEKQQKMRVQKQQKLSIVDTKFFLKTVKFYFQILASLARFIQENPQLSFFQRFLGEFYAFIEERVKYFFSLRSINDKTSVSDFLLYLGLIQYWIDINQQVYDSLGKLKLSITDQYLTVLQKNALVNELKKSIDESSYLPYSISSNHINSFYYVIFWTQFQKLKHQDLNNMSLTILKDENKLIFESQQPLFQENVKMLNFQSDLKIIDKKILFKKQEYYVCQSFIALVKQLQKYLQLREVLNEFNSNIQEKICEVVGFYVWYNLKNVNKTGQNVPKRSLKNLCNIYSTIKLLKLIFTEQLNIENKKFLKTMEQFNEFFKTLDNSITMTPFLLIEQQISFIYQNNAMNSQFQVPCKQTLKILQIIKLCLQELKIHFSKQKIVKILETSMKIINKNYFGYLISLGKRGLLQIKQFLPKYKELLLNYGFKRQRLLQEKNCGGMSQAKQSEDTYIFLKQLTEMEKTFKSKISQLK